MKNETRCNDGVARASGPIGLLAFATLVCPVAAYAQSPDLVVTSVVAPASVGAGSSIEVSWTVENQGDDSADIVWSDKILISLLPGTYRITGAQQRREHWRLRAGPVGPAGRDTEAAGVRQSRQRLDQPQY